VGTHIWSNHQRHGSARSPLVLPDTKQRPDKFKLKDKCSSLLLFSIHLSDVSDLLFLRFAQLTQNRTQIVRAKSQKKGSINSNDTNAVDKCKQHNLSEKTNWTKEHTLFFQSLSIKIDFESEKERTKLQFRKMRAYRCDLSQYE
jgi:hypothetical protein